MRRKRYLISTLVILAVMVGLTIHVTGLQRTLTSLGTAFVLGLLFGLFAIILQALKEYRITSKR